MAPLALSEAVGKRMRSMRNAAGITAEEVAVRARLLGLTWQRSTVTSIENGRRNLSGDELLLLPVILSAVIPGGVTLHELLLFSDQVALAEHAWVTPDGIQALLDGILPEQSPSAWTLPGLVAFAGERQEAYREDVRRLLRQIPPDSDREVARVAAVDMNDDVVWKAAKRLGVTPFQVAFAARSLWNRSLLEERRAREVERGGDDRSEGSRRMVASHITRRMLDELRPVVADYPKPASVENSKEDT